DDADVLLRTFVRIVAWIAIAEGTAALLWFLLMRWHGGSTNLLWYVRALYWRGFFLTLGDVGSLLAGILLIAAGIGCLRFHRLARRALLAGALLVVVTRICTWLG